MKATEYITKFQALVARHGDLEVVDHDDAPLDDPEFNDDDDAGPPVFVAAKLA